MRHPSSASVLAALLALSWMGFFATAPHAQERHRLNDKWAYKAVKQADLNEAGEAGWEAYAVWREAHDSEPTVYVKKRGN